MVWEKKHQKKVGFADDSINGHTVDLQSDNFLEWGPDHQGFVFIEMVQKEVCVLCMEKDEIKNSTKVRIW